MHAYEVLSDNEKRSSYDRHGEAGLKAAARGILAVLLICLSHYSRAWVVWADKAKAWLISLPSGSITTWNELVQAFLMKYFPHVKSAKMRSDITNFFQQDMESIHEAWERYKDLLWRCPHHGLLIWSQVQTFYNGLLPNIQVMIDAANGGALNNKTLEEAYILIEVMASNNYMRPSMRNSTKKAAGVHEVDGNRLSKDCQEGNSFAQPERANYVNNFQRGQENSYSSTYTPAWHNHPNFLWSNNNEHKPPPGFQPQKKRSNRESMFTKFIEESGKRFDKNESQLQKYEVLLQNQSASIRNLETQMGQIHNILEGRVQGTFSSDTEKNPKERVNAIILRSDMLEQMPKYAKFLKEIITKKRRFEEHETVMLKEECSALLLKKLPQKLRDLGSFTIPCTIGRKTIKGATDIQGSYQMDNCRHQRYKPLNLHAQDFNGRKL
ncbi:uncharacterized protein LOC116141632 [Pistacia vera]|uniref:uncharacterized protein LOC116141632 n=1 Tax=Pistacia vera TaxID=55513 RepID=UPI001263DA13|nr:uncharacterized protein LOC116141632 [Pistacia vera]